MQRSYSGNLEGPGTVTDRFGFTYEVPDLREPIAFHLLINGAYEPEIQDLLLRALPTRRRVHRRRRQYWHIYNTGSQTRRAIRPRGRYRGFPGRVQRPPEEYRH